MGVSTLDSKRKNSHNKYMEFRTIETSKSIVLLVERIEEEKCRDQFINEWKIVFIVGG